MKAIILAIALMCSINLYALEEDNTTNEHTFGLTCSDKEVINSSFNSYATGNSSHSLSAVNKSSIIINKKAKLITAWVIFYLTPEGSGDFTNTNLGYLEIRKIFDIKNNKVKDLEVVYYNCRGTNLESYTRHENWSSIVPNSLDYNTMKYLKEYTKIK